MSPKIGWIKPVSRSFTSHAFFSAGKPLRIKLATRLGIGRLSDSMPAFHRHFVADVPDKLVSLSEPIRCARVTFDIPTIERALLDIHGVHDVAVRCRQDGSPEAFVSAAGLKSSELKEAISDVLPGYATPDPLHVFPGNLKKNASGDVDFAGMEAEIAEMNASAMSEQALLVRDIIGNLLTADPGKINGDADFFLLGGYVRLSMFWMMLNFCCAETLSFWGNSRIRFAKRPASVSLWQCCLHTPRSRKSPLS